MSPDRGQTERPLGTPPSGDDGGHVPLGPGREFDLVRALVAQWQGQGRGIGDDAAVLNVGGEPLVASIDTMVDRVHFRHDWLSLEEIGYRAAVAALSDLAAMAATPIGLLVAVTLPRSLLGAEDELGRGLGEAARLAGCPIVGGDTTRGDALSLTIAVLGTAARPVRRSGARAGDGVYVTGRLGGPGAAIAALSAGAPVPAPWRQRFARPLPRLREARWLAERGATALIDVSDGAASELRHLATASGVAIHVELERLPVLDGIDPQEALSSGEEYELLCAAPLLDTAEFAREFGLPLSRIGETRAGTPAVVLTMGGERVDLPLGYDHFST
jgi:thiamine-monophosphate kinase